MLNINNHPYHIVDYSPWPLNASMISILIIINTTQIFFNNNNILLTTTLILIILIPYNWWQDIAREASIQGLHANNTLKNINLGIILFITSEILFFFSFFWILLHSNLTVNIELGINWPPISITIFNPYSVPILNTIVLLSSGVTITSAHNYMLNNNHNNISLILITTIFLGAYFTIIQTIEYIQAPFTISDSIFGSSFFVATGFHGVHVLVGTIILTTTLVRSNNNQNSAKHHFGFEASAWYWHFVDVVWLFLYSLIYCWFYN